MARVIIQGSKEECDKAYNSLQNVFSNCDKKARISTEGESMIVLDVYQERFGKDGFSDEEIDLALTCHSSAIRRCDLCPYRKEPGCTEKLLIDGSIWLTRKIKNNPEVKSC